MLTELNFGDNKIGDAGAKAIADALRFNAALTELELRGNKMGNKAKKALQEAAKARPGLELKL